MKKQNNTTTKLLNQNRMEKKYFIIEVGEDISSSFLFDILDKLRQQGHYFVVSCTSNTSQFDFKRVTKEEFNKFNGYEQD